jgi:D-alanyl-D-alanine carboxypeptidase
MSRILMVLMVSAAIGVGVLMAGAGGSKVDASPPANEGASSTMPHQQGGHKGGLDPALEKSLEAAFEKSFKQSGVPGAIAAVRTPEGTWVSTLGVANKASGKPMRADMHHRIGSVTKTFTATLLLKADAEGRLSLNDTIDQYVKGVPNGDEITLRQMAKCPAGLQATRSISSSRKSSSPTRGRSGSQRSWRVSASRIPLCSIPAKDGSTPTPTK